MNLILGHNQFIGISHISEERSRERVEKFSSIENIYKVVEKAADVGFKGMIIETHPIMLEFLNYYKKNRTFEMDFYLQVPYVQGYIKDMNEKGLSGIISEVVQRGGLQTASVMALKSMINYAKKDYLSIAISALQLELSPFTDIKVKTIFLHNVLTDLLLSLNAKEPFIEYLEYIKEKLNMTPGFITLNFPMFKERTQEWKFKPTHVMTPINMMGYDMNPSKKAVEYALRTYGGKIMAMNVLGGGAFPVEDVFSYLSSISNIHSCVIGASSETHLKDLVFHAKEYK